MTRRAVIFAGGKGTRLAPFTTVLPKPLLPVGGTPILETVLRQLQRHGFHEVTLAVGHLASLIRAYFDEHPLSREIALSYFQESEPLGTVGAVGLIDELETPFLAMNGDILTSLDYRAMYRFHERTEAALTIAVTKKKVQIELGVLALDHEDGIVGYDEKPTKEYPASMGIYIYGARALHYVRPNEYLDVPTLVLRLIDAGERVQAYTSDTFWLDMGNRDDYERASAEFEARRELFLGNP